VKKIFTIALLITFLFNLGGYYVFFWALKVQANKELSFRLDEGKYKEQETFEIKIPLSLPYPLQTTDFQRQSGHFTYKHEHYQLVKQKYANDTLTIIAIKDVQSNQLANAMDTFSESSGTQSAKDGVLNVQGKVLIEYLNAASTALSMIDGWSRIISPVDYLEFFPAVSIALKSPPPKT
jgi:hypothetical protein